MSSPLLDRPADLGEAESVMLTLLSVLQHDAGDGVRREVAEWYADALNGLLDSSMGPRPRRSRLFSVLGQLIDRQLVDVTVAGLKLSESAAALAAQLTDDRPDLVAAIRERQAVAQEHQTLLFD